MEDRAVHHQQPGHRRERPADIRGEPGLPAGSPLGGKDGAAAICSPCGAGTPGSSELLTPLPSAARADARRKAASALAATARTRIRDRSLGSPAASSSADAPDLNNIVMGTVIYDEPPGEAAAPSARSVATTLSTCSSSVSA